jgi:Na+-translocating ferredoxin:NAD+ oxidoreductase RnfG subunit
VESKTRLQRGLKLLGLLSIICLSILCGIKDPTSKGIETELKRKTKRLIKKLWNQRPDFKGD